MIRTPLNSRGKGDSAYMRQADALIQAWASYRPCAICTSLGICNTYQIAGHHIIPKSRSRLLRFDLRNIIPVCSDHHTTGNDICPHSLNNCAVDNFDEWVQNNKPEDWNYLQEHKHDLYTGRSYRDQYNHLKMSLESKQ